MSAFASARRSTQWLLSCRVASASTGTNLALRSAPRCASTGLYAASTHSVKPCILSASSFRWFSTSPDEADSDNEGARYFSDLENMHPKTLLALQKQGIETMTEIQAKTWEAVSEGKDVLGRSRTGSGKTLAFLLPTLERIIQESQDNPEEGIKMLIISPTRELASQIHKTAENLVKAHRGINAQVLYGGVPRGGDLMRMDRELPTILTATPGRLQDHLEALP